VGIANFFLGPLIANPLIYHYHFNAALEPGKNFDAAPAPPLLYPGSAKLTFLKQAKVNTRFWEIFLSRFLFDLNW
jgi:hypothetical protein